MNKIFLLTISYNEELNIEYMFKNVENFVDDIFILDSYSTDKTIEIAQKYTKNIFYRKFDNFYNQRKFLLNLIKKSQIISENDWVLILDCDEFLSDEIKIEIKNKINQSKYDAYYLNRKFIWNGVWIKRGGYFPRFLLRLIRVKEVTLDTKFINEHYLSKNNNNGYLDNIFFDKNRKTLNNWIIKHFLYSKFESELYFIKNKNLSKNMLIWNKLPILLRPFILLFYRLIIKKGFLDGVIATCYHFLHSFLYRLLIDIYIIKKILLKWFRLD
tara:strand:- start:470 stop:1282 length:813 start_codon:yes stop_codon:yes gene_type:complete